MYCLLSVYAIYILTIILFLFQQLSYAKTKSLVIARQEGKGGLATTVSNKTSKRNRPDSNEDDEEIEEGMKMKTARAE